jgi:hypothetical protein
VTKKKPSLIKRGVWGEFIYLMRMKIYSSS